MTEVEVNTFKIDPKSIKTIEEVDEWLDKLSRVLNGYIHDLTGTEVKKEVSKRAKERIWMFVDPLLDRRLELM